MNRTTIRFAKEPVKPLVPHDAAAMFEPLDTFATPSILLSPEAYADSHYIMDAAGRNEVGWLGTVQPLTGARYLIGKVFLFDQRVSMIHSEIDPDRLGRFYAELLKQDPANRALLSSILFWGHLHPGSMSEPSDQDDKQMRIFANNPFFIRGIFTRRGKCVFDFFDYARRLKVIDCPWSIYLGDDARRQAIADEVRDKVKQGPFATPRRGKWPLRTK